MVRGDVGDDCDVCFEVVHVVKLEAAELQNVDVEFLGSHLISIALADVTAQTHVHSCLLEEMINQGSGSGLSVATCDAHLLCIVIATCELDFRDHIDAAVCEFSHHRGSCRDAGALDDLVCIENKIL